MRLGALCERLRVSPPLFWPHGESQGQRPQAGQGRGYRHRARLAVRGTPAHPAVGLFRAGTHSVVDAPDCPVHAPAINAVASAVRRAIREANVAPYSESAHRGLLRYLQAVVERSTGRVQLVLVGNSEEREDFEPLWRAVLRHSGPVALHSLHLNYHSQRSNAILGARTERVWGDEFVVETLGGAQVFFAPGSFGQANLPLFERLVERVHDWLASAPRVLELYAGVGALGLGLVKRGQHVTFNEVAPMGLVGLRRGLDELATQGLWAGGSYELLPGAAEDVLRAGALGGSYDAVLVDPPRKGLGPAVVDALLAEGPGTLVYVSCGLSSFELDAERLGEDYELVRCEGAAMFPYTEHVETLALFRRRQHPPKTRA